MLKDKILRELYKTRIMISGEALAEKFGVSRNAVWKSIKQLQNEGFAIAASTNKGYFLENCGKALSPILIKEELGESAFGKELYYFPELNSTNLKAKELAENGCAHGTVVIAASQTAGKGRLGRQFYSPREKGLYMSIVVRPEKHPGNAMLITSMCAAATAKAVEAVAPVKVYIKWVNDLFIGGKKVCGILTEAGIKLEDQSIDYVVIGIGVNCGKQTFPAELSEIATSLENEVPVPVNKNRLAAEIIKNISAGLADLESKKFLGDCRKRSNILGKPITVFRGEAQFPAIALDIDDSGALLIRTQDGQTLALNSGEVSIRL